MVGRPPGPLTITDSTISGNTAGGDGGGLFMCGDGTITNTTVSGNTSEQFDSGGGIWVIGNLSLLNVTVAENAASGILLEGPGLGDAFGVGGGIFNADANVTVKNTIIANNRAATAAAGIRLWAQPGQRRDLRPRRYRRPVGVDPLLEGLADNGGPTERQALPADSPAVDTADDTGAPTPTSGGCPARGRRRRGRRHGGAATSAPT